MKEPIQIIQFVKQTTYNLVRDLLGDQNEIKRFVYTAVYKQYHCFSSIEELFLKLSSNPNHEFSIGILLRSMLMDCIQIQHLRFLQLQGTPDTQQQTNEEVRKGAYKFIVDGTRYIMNDIEDNPNIERSDKGIAYRSISATFPGVFVFNGDLLPSVEPGFRFTLADLHRNSQHTQLLSLKHVYELYQFYSKYDHLSHWTSVFNSDSPVEHKKKQMESAFAMIAINLRDLLVVGTSSEIITELMVKYEKKVSEFLKEMV